jgi:hypothetical protein
MKKTISTIAFSLLLMLFFNCSQEDVQTLEPATVNNITGTIVNEQNQPVSGAEIRVRGVVTTSQNDGTFSINGEPDDNGFIYIKVTKAGFKDGSKTFVYSQNSNYSVRVMLVNNTITQTINSGVISTVTLPNGTKVVFPKFYKDMNNVNYEGAVTVSISHILPSNNDKQYIYKGMVVNNNNTTQQRNLRIYGLVLVEMKGAAGQLLDISNASNLAVTFALESSQLATTPTSGTLLDFDDYSGYWEPSGNATQAYDVNGDVIQDKITGSATKANGYRYTRSNRQRGIAFVGREEGNGFNVNTENGVTESKK